MVMWMLIEAGVTNLFWSEVKPLIMAQSKNRGSNQNISERTVNKNSLREGTIEEKEECYRGA